MHCSPSNHVRTLVIASDLDYWCATFPTPTWTVLPSLREGKTWICVAIYTAHRFGKNLWFNFPCDKLLTFSACTSMSMYEFKRSSLNVQSKYFHDSKQNPWHTPKLQTPIRIGDPCSSKSQNSETYWTTLNHNHVSVPNWNDWLSLIDLQ